MTNAQDRTIKRFVDDPRVARAQVTPMSHLRQEVWCYDPDDVLLCIITVGPSGSYRSRPGWRFCPRESDNLRADWSSVR